MFHKGVVGFAIFSFIIIPITASRILAIVPSPLYSHQISFRRIWLELLQRGHHVTLVTTNPMNDPKLVNLTEVDLHDSYKVLEEFYQQLHKVSGMFEKMRLVVQTADDVLDYQLSHESMKQFIKNESLFDVVISECFMFEFQALADLYKCPKILVSSYEPLNFNYGYLGNHMNPVANPDVLIPFVAGRMDFKERLISFVHEILYNAFKSFWHFSMRHNMLKKHFGEEVRTPQEILKDTDLLLINTNPLTNDIRVVGPNVIQYGGGVHIFPPQPLREDLQDYLDSATEGCIYFSLGTNSKSMHLGKEKIDVIMETLSELPYKVLWKFEIEDMIKPPKNIKFISWAPQQDILRHPNIKLFITQGGLQSLEESIISHVPMVMLPIYADQESNAKRMEYRGLARVVPHKPMPVKEEFKSIIMDVINDPKYKERVIKTAELLLDQPMTGVEKAVWWIEYVIRHKGAKHLKNPAVDIPTYQYYCLDVIGAILSFFYIVFKIISWILRGLKKLIWRKPKVARRVAQKKKKQ